MLIRKLIEDWLPITEIGIESDRERGASSALPPIYYLHTWWARRPLVMSRAAVLASILPASADRKKFIHALGIHGDPIKTRRVIDQANREKKKLANPYGYKRAFTYNPNEADRTWIIEEIGRDLETVLVVDPTAGGGSILVESGRLGCATIANDINPVAALILYATILWPNKFGTALIKEFQDICKQFVTVAALKYKDIFSSIDENTIINGYLWARTIPCPYCSGLIPLSPNWRIAPDGVGVKLKPYESDGLGSEGRICSFQMVNSLQHQSKGTVSRGSALCPYPDCMRVISSNEIKTAAKSGNMGEQLYAVAYKKRVTSWTKTGKLRHKWIKKYREPKPEDYDDKSIMKTLKKKLHEWGICDLIPSEKFPIGSDNRPITYGMPLWRDFFSPRQLLCHGTTVETFHNLLNDDKKNNSLTDIRKAAYGYLAIAIDTVVTYNSRLSTWDSASGRGIRNSFARHDYAFKWSHAEMVPLITGLGYEWAFTKTLDSIKKIICLTEKTSFINQDHNTMNRKYEPIITCKSGDDLEHIEDHTADAVVIDPPYYDNVMYAELSDFFYVWLKRTAGHVFPELFKRNLTDKENEAVANPAKFFGYSGARAMAKQDYVERMALIFDECRRILKPTGIMTVMFMHKSTGAWDALAMSIINAGFYITTSWPINSEARGSLHIRNKAAAKSTILLACRPRQTKNATTYWEDIEPEVRKSVYMKINEFEEAGLRGVDIYLSAFGPALEVYSRNWPLSRRTPRRDNSKDPYKVVPEDALRAARREVKQWRLDKLINSVPNKKLDPATAFFVLAWDTFASPRFPYDEALHLARAVGVDLDRTVVGRFAKKAGGYVVLLDSMRRKASRPGSPHRGARTMIDELHHIAYLCQKSGAAVAIEYIESEQLDTSHAFAAALEAALEVLPPSHRHTGIDLVGDLASASGDFDALFDIYHLKFKKKIDDPDQLKIHETSC